MKFTDNELKLSRRLHDALLKRGEPMEIREGDWVIGRDGKPFCISMFHFNIPFARQSLQEQRNKYVLLGSWERCREWLRERGLELDAMYDLDDKAVSVLFRNMKDNTQIHKVGATDLEAILSVCVAVAEEE